MPADVAGFAGGRYRVLRLLGEGSNKRVYLAHDQRLDRQVAIASIKSEGMDEAGLERVQREAQAMGRLGSHPDIVTIFDIGEEDGRPFLVMELMTGGDLRSVLQARPERRLPLPRAIEVVLAVCRALQAAHAAGIVHRDLKPENVWLTSDGVVKLGDFGIAAVGSRTRVTQTSMIIGTPLYLAPEQALSGAVTGRADLYSLGVMLYELSTGRRPFVGDDFVAVIYQHIHTPPVAPSWHNPEVTPALESLILRLMAKAPENRPADAAEVIAELTQIGRAPAVASEVAPAPVAAVNPLDRLAAGVFVGRGQELAALRTALEEARAGRTRMVLLSGEPGAGKTRTAEELATYARLRGVRVFWGRCFEEGTPAFWPWVQLVRAAVVERETVQLRAELGTGAADIAQLVTAVRERLPDLPAAPVLDADHSRLRLFESIAGYLANASRSEPILLVLDDLQWADASSLLLLQFLARELREARLMLVGTYRDAALDRQHRLATALGDLARVPSVQRLHLGALSEEDVARFVEANTALAPSPALLDAVYRGSEGNAFFMVEMVRLLAADGRLASGGEIAGSVVVPQGVREVLHRRLAHLSDGAAAALSAAAVVGREFDLGVLARVMERGEDDVLAALEAAAAGRIVAEAPNVLGRFSFTHALIRETLYDDLSHTRRARLHRRVAEALEAAHARGLEPHLAELAHHFAAAGAAGDPVKAVTYGQMAGDRALALFAYEEAARHYTAAVAILDGEGDAAEDIGAARRRLLLALGDALNRADQIDESNAAFLRAAEAARGAGDADALARAALGFAGVEPAPGADNAARVRLLEEALAALGDSAGAVRARVMARLALELHFAEAQERPAALAREAVATARRADDPGAMAYGLHAWRLVTGWLDPPDGRLRMARSIIRLADQAGDRALALTGRHWCLVDLLEMGDIAAADAEIATCEEQAAALRQPVFLWYSALIRAMRAMLDGRIAEAERHAGEALNIGQRAHGSTALQTYAAQLLVIRREQGRLGELAPMLQALVAQNPSVAAWRSALAFVLSELGRMDEARAEFERVAADDLAGVPRDSLWLGMVAVLAEACAALGDGRRAAVLYDQLRPFDGRNVVLANALACIGATSYYLGLLAATGGDAERAVGHFEAALALHRRMGARPWMARTQHRLALALLLRQAAGDRERAAALLGEARATAAALDMQGLLARVGSLRVSVEG